MEGKGNAHDIKNNLSKMKGAIVLKWRKGSKSHIRYWKRLERCHTPSRPSTNTVLGGEVKEWISQPQSHFYIYWAALIGICFLPMLQAI